jgi:uncharacterized repeat protein (TIGR03803 family)
LTATTDRQQIESNSSRSKQQKAAEMNRIQSSIITAAMALLTASGSCAQAAAPPAKTEYQAIKSFPKLGSAPTALITGSDGSLYGTFQSGGNKGEGVVFKVNKDGSDYKVLHHFTGYRGGADGSWPRGVLEGKDGVLYGTTQSGGTPSGMFHDTGGGTVFKVNKDGSGYAVLHRFTGGDADGIEPWGGLVEGLDGALYGTTLSGGRITRVSDPLNMPIGGAGTVFRLNKDGSGFKVVHSFQGPDDDGSSPMAGLLAGSDGALYGTTDNGGNTSARNGTVFKLNPDGSGYKILHNFPDEKISGDGRMPRAALVEGKNGTLFGTTQAGGGEDYGTVFKLRKDGTGYQVVHRFTGGGAAGDGGKPSGLLVGRDGAIYGTTEYHGKNGGGTAFKLNSDGIGFTVLRQFPDGVGDARAPSGRLVLGSDGAIYGMTKSSDTTNISPEDRLLRGLDSSPILFKFSLGGSGPVIVPPK